jgi:hypothetical protein
VFLPRPVLAPKRAAVGPSPSGKHDAQKRNPRATRNSRKAPAGIGEERRGPGRVRAEARAVIRATDIFLTHGVYRIGPGRACRAKP